jgi:hypothetical protein
MPCTPSIGSMDSHGFDGPNRRCRRRPTPAPLGASLEPDPVPRNAGCALAAEIAEGLSGTLPETNNTTSAAFAAALRPYPDLVVNSLSVDPAAVQTGQAVTVSWQTVNVGTEPVGRSFTEQVKIVSQADGRELTEPTVVVHDAAASGPIGANQSRDRSLTIMVPDGSPSAGSWTVTVTTDYGDVIFEHNGSGTGETNNSAGTPLSVSLAPYPDLVTSGVSGPSGTIIADPAHITVGWKVTNSGNREAQGAGWFDVVYASPDTTFGDANDVEVARFERTAALAAGTFYIRSEEIVLPPPPGLKSGRYYLFVQADAADRVFEDGIESNNVVRTSDFFDVMPIPYADLVVSAVNVPESAWSGQELQVSWRVDNHGIGLTDRSIWTDTVWLTSDADGTEQIGSLGSFTHFGQLAVGDGYDRTVTVPLPDGLSGTYYVAVQTAVPAGGEVFEFIYGDNNRGASGPVAVQLTPPPDLTVTDIVAPALAVQEGTPIDIQWTVQNVGPGKAGGDWLDTVYLRKVGDPNAPTVPLGTYGYNRPLEAGLSYTRREQVLLPTHIVGNYEAVVVTNYDRRLFENNAYGNNRRVDDQDFPITLQPRPDLRVSVDPLLPVDPNQNVGVTFTVSNLGNAATTTPHWTDRVWLSLDPVISSDDVLVESSGNQSALGPGDSYRTSTKTVTVPWRFRGTVYVIVQTDADSQVDEFPKDDNNIGFAELYVRPQPLPDLVVSNVVVPTQVVAGATAEVRFTVTNLGPGGTPVEDWTDTVWLTRDKNRPHPGQGDFLLKSLPHQGALANGAGYDVRTTVQIPDQLSSGTYYLMPWTDPYDVVLEDTLAVNANPDDPTEIDNNNYKAGRGTTVIATTVPEPDLTVTSVTPTAQALAGTPFTVTWTVKNQGKGLAGGSWVDHVWLTQSPDVEPDLSNSLFLGAVTHDGELKAGEVYTGELTVTLSPAARGQTVVVTTDSANAVAETDETNNRRAAATLVTPVPADLVVTRVEVPADNRSGELTTVRYTVQNQGAYPVWPGTSYWTDYVWISADREFLRDRASFFGQSVHSNDRPLQPGDSYTVEVTALLPKGIGGNLFVYIHPDAHDGNFGVVQTGWWPADHGKNDEQLDHFSRWAYEDPRNNVYREPIHVTYYEPDLVVGAPQISSTPDPGRRSTSASP